MLQCLFYMCLKIYLNLSQEFSILTGVSTCFKRKHQDLSSNSRYDYQIIKKKIQHCGSFHKFTGNFPLISRKSL